MKTWAREEMERLNSIDRADWTVEDWEAFAYIENVNAEADYYASMD